MLGGLSPDAAEMTAARQSKNANDTARRPIATPNQYAGVAFEAAKRIEEENRPEVAAQSLFRVDQSACVRVAESHLCAFGKRLNGRHMQHEVCEGARIKALIAAVSATVMIR